MSFSDKAVPYVVGGGAFFLLVGIFFFYPAFIWALQIPRWFFGTPDEMTFWHIIFCLVLMILGTCIIVSLFAAEQYFIVLMIYLSTLWPFLYILYHYYISLDEIFLETFPLPVNWVPFF